VPYGHNFRGAPTGNFRSEERKYRGMKSPDTVRVRVGTKIASVMYICLSWIENDTELQSLACTAVLTLFLIPVILIVLWEL